MPTSLIQTNLKPIIYHNPGRSVKSFICRKTGLWRVNQGELYLKKIQERLFADKSKKGAFRRPAELAIVTASNYARPTIAELSLKHIGITDYSVVGKNILNWENRLKIDLILDFARKAKEEYILFMDGSDAVINDNPDLILEWFLSVPNAEIIFNGDKVNWPELTEAAAFESAAYGGQYPHLNSGVFIGKTKTIIRFFEECKTMADQKKYVDDQDVIRRRQRDWHPAVQVDSDCRIFLNLFWPDPEEMARYGIKVPAQEVFFHTSYAKVQWTIKELRAWAGKIIKRHS